MRIYLLFVSFQMMKATVVLACAAVVVTAFPSVKLPVLDEAEIQEAYVQDAEEARPRTFVYRPILETFGEDEESFDTSPRIYRSIRDDEEEVEEGREPRRHLSFVEDEDEEIQEDAAARYVRSLVDGLTEEEEEAYPRQVRSVQEEARVLRSVRSIPEVFIEAEEIFSTPVGSMQYEDGFGNLEREKRSLQPGAPDFGVGGQQNRDWGADVRREGPNTKVSIDGKHRGQGYDVEGQWSKVVRGPGKAKPDWHVGVRW